MKGQSIIELLIAVGIFIIILSGMVFLIFSGYDSGRLAREMEIANFLAGEGLEVVKTIRDDSWSNLTTGEHGLATSGDEWIFQGSEEDLSDYLTQGRRKIIVEEIDSSLKKIISQISWSFSKTRNEEIKLMTYLSNWQSLAGDWSFPFQESSLDLSGNQNGLKIQVKDDYTYLVRNGGTMDFTVIDVQDTLSPFVASSLNLSNSPVNISLSGNYAFISSANNNSEFQIINLDDPLNPALLGSYNAPASANANGAAARWPLAYLLRSNSSENEFSILDVSFPGNINLLGSLNLNDTANELVLLGDYAFIASGNNGQELQVVDVISSSGPSLAGSYNLSGNSNALTIDGFENTVVLGRADGMLHIFDVSVPSSPVLSGSFNAGGAINDISLGNDNKYVFLGSDSNAAEFQVVDISTPASPVLVGSFNLSPNLDIIGVAYDELKDRVFASLESGSQEFIIIAP